MKNEIRSTLKLFVLTCLTATFLPLSFADQVAEEKKEKTLPPVIAPVDNAKDAQTQSVLASSGASAESHVLRNDKNESGEHNANEDQFVDVKNFIVVRSNLNSNTVLPEHVIPIVRKSDGWYNLPYGLNIRFHQENLLWEPPVGLIIEVCRRVSGGPQKFTIKDVKLPVILDPVFGDLEHGAIKFMHGSPTFIEIGDVRIRLEFRSVPTNMKVELNRSIAEARQPQAKLQPQVELPPEEKQQPKTENVLKTYQLGEMGKIWERSGGKIYNLFEKCLMADGILKPEELAVCASHFEIAGYAGGGYGGGMSSNPYAETVDEKDKYFMIFYTTKENHKIIRKSIDMINEELRPLLASPTVNAKNSVASINSNEKTTKPAADVEKKQPALKNDTPVNTNTPESKTSAIKLKGHHLGEFARHLDKDELELILQNLTLVNETNRENDIVFWLRPREGKSTILVYATDEFHQIIDKMLEELNKELQPLYSPPANVKEKTTKPAADVEKKQPAAKNEKANPLVPVVDKPKNNLKVKIYSFGKIPNNKYEIEKDVLFKIFDYCLSVNAIPPSYWRLDFNNQDEVCVLLIATEENHRIVDAYLTDIDKELQLLFSAPADTKEKTTKPAAEVEKKQPAIKNGKANPLNLSATPLGSVLSASAISPIILANVESKDKLKLKSYSLGEIMGKRLRLDGGQFITFFIDYLGANGISETNNLSYYYPNHTDADGTMFIIFYTTEENHKIIGKALGEMDEVLRSTSSLPTLGTTASTPSNPITTRMITRPRTTPRIPTAGRIIPNDPFDSLRANHPVASGNFPHNSAEATNQLASDIKVSKRVEKELREKTRTESAAVIDNEKVIISYDVSGFIQRSENVTKKVDHLCLLITKITDTQVSNIIVTPCDKNETSVVLHFMGTPKQHQQIDLFLLFLHELSEQKSQSEKKHLQDEAQKWQNETKKLIVEKREKLRKDTESVVVADNKKVVVGCYYMKDLVQISENTSREVMDDLSLLLTKIMDIPAGGIIKSEISVVLLITCTPKQHEQIGLFLRFVRELLEQKSQSEKKLLQDEAQKRQYETEKLLVNEREKHRKEIDLLKERHNDTTESFKKEIEKQNEQLKEIKTLLKGKT
ncbi:MAG: hypothetical protein LBJ00_10855 [Planctomycetaceae bacterium]|jgi:hypothetical protein|nr:hypothetical protein [Planctomycetaceae bacterium]